MLAQAMSSTSAAAHWRARSVGLACAVKLVDSGDTVLELVAEPL